MTIPETHDAVALLPQASGPGVVNLTHTEESQDRPPIHTKAKDHNIRVSPAVLEAAGKDGEELLHSLRTSLRGLTQTEAEERARTVGPNEVAQERRQGWPIRLLKIIRNPLVILLAILSSISFATETRAPEL